jgi:hypothetical protein
MRWGGQPSRLRYGAGGGILDPADGGEVESLRVGFNQK